MKLSRLIIAIILGVSIGGGAIFLILGRTEKNIESPVRELSNKPASATPTSSKLLTWNDPAGFEFQYPDGLAINKHEDDNLNYAHLEFTSKDHKGNLIVWAKDSTDSLDSWVQSDKRFKGASVINTTFAGIDGKKILISSPSAMIITGTIDQSILFTVETDLTDKEFWSKVHDTIAGSFAFTSDNSSQGASSSSGGDEAVDEEETIQ